MPLRAEVNAEILSWLSPASLRKLNATWRARGVGHPDEVISEIVGRLDQPDFDYEALLAHLEMRYLDDAREGFAQAYHGLYAWLAQVVYLLLYRRQVERRDSYREGLQYFEGIARLAKANRPLWIFSLNHDVLVECIAALFGIEVNCGFSSRTVALPCRNGEGRRIAALAAEVLTDAELGSGQLPFFKEGWPGINLLKLHGALDVFTLGDGRDLIRLKPNDQTFDAIIDALQIANEGLLDAKLTSQLVPDPLAVTNKIPYLDGNDQPQVLGRTLLASATRLTDPYPQLMQRRLLEYFRANLAEADRLVAIGYGMGDAEINDILREWLADAGPRRLEIVAPGIVQIPPPLLPFSAQIALVPASATTYLETC
ncbi:MAG TPA: hypothetical protein VIM14_01900 [Polyangia bacterium]